MVMGETHFMKDVGSNPCMVYRMDIFAHELIEVCLKNTENKSKIGE